MNQRKLIVIYIQKKTWKILFLKYGLWPKQKRFSYWINNKKISTIPIHRIFLSCTINKIFYFIHRVIESDLCKKWFKSSLKQWCSLDIKHNKSYQNRADTPKNRALKTLVWLDKEESLNSKHSSCSQGLWVQNLCHKTVKKIFWNWKKVKAYRF